MRYIFLIRKRACVYKCVRVYVRIVTARKPNRDKYQVLLRDGQTTQPTATMAHAQVAVCNVT